MQHPTCRSLPVGIGCDAASLRMPWKSNQPGEQKSALSSSICSCCRGVCGAADCSCFECWPQIPPVLLRSALRSTRGAKAPGASLRELPSCRRCWAVAGCALGTFPSSSVSCPQLNVTAWGPQDGGFLQVERLRLSSSVTEHPLPAHGPGTRYTVAVRGLTAAGAGAALLGDFQSNGSGKGVRALPPALPCLAGPPADARPWLFLHRHRSPS